MSATTAAIEQLDASLVLKVSVYHMFDYLFVVLEYLFLTQKLMQN